MQHDYTHDTAGRPGAVSADAPRWLRLTRSGDTLTGYESADGTHWTEVGTAPLAGLPATVQVGLFVTSPSDLTRARWPRRRRRGTARLSQATADFDNVASRARARRRLDAATTSARSGPGRDAHHPGERRAGGGVHRDRHRRHRTRLAGAAGLGVERALIGTFAGLIVVIVVARCSSPPNTGAA